MTNQTKDLFALNLIGIFLGITIGASFLLSYSQILTTVGRISSLIIFVISLIVLYLQVKLFTKKLSIV